MMRDRSGFSDAEQQARGDVRGRGGYEGGGHDVDAPEDMRVRATARAESGEQQVGRDLKEAVAEEKNAGREA